MKRAQSLAPRAFSLLELTLVVAIMGVLLAVVAIAFGPRLLRAKARATEATMQTTKQALITCEGDTNAMPAALTGLVGPYLEKLPKDGWGRDFYYKTPGANGKPFDLISRGPDGQLDTADDINIWILEQTS